MKIKFNNSHKIVKKTQFILFFSFYLVFSSLNAIAQTPIQPVFPPPKTPLEPQPLPPLEEILPAPETPSPSTQPSLEDIPGTVIIRKFEVVGSTVFSPEELAKVLKPFTLRPITFAELLEAQRAITQLYVDNGYITSGAFIPPQAVKRGVINIEVIEGEVESINITGLEHLNSGYVRSRLEVATGTPLNVNKLLNALQLLQLDPLIDNLSAELATGSHSGVSILEVEVREADAFDLQLSFDNQRSPSVGTDRRQIQLTHNNLFGFGDRFNIGYINTDGSNTLNDLSYTVPINAYNGTVGVSFNYSDSEIIEEPFDILDIESTTRQYELTYRQPLYQTPTEDFAIGITFSRQESETSLLDRPFPLSRGANNEGETNISALRFFQEYTTRSERSVFALRSQLSLGIDVFDATINDDNEPDSKFLTWRGQAQYLNLLTPDITLLLRSDLQLSDRPLVPLEQFSLGGALNVRGYRQDALLADNGLFLSAEMRASILRIPDWNTTLQLTPFVDFGTVWNSDRVELEKDTLLSVGLGLRLLIGDDFTARLDWGIPLIDITSSKIPYKENGVYFSIEYRPF
ncbi:ShlB/FhaC/HecB family hemolysin secretion/activation protein [Candidatus Gracilibacteria bacterium]|nr:ShlB/FhaC/HecB family hemolysin secretion/activation protein [Candidatus Gracilibacteria bacterium]